MGTPQAARIHPNLRTVLTRPILTIVSALLGALISLRKGTEVQTIQVDEVRACIDLM